MRAILDELFAAHRSHEDLLRKFYAEQAAASETRRTAAGKVFVARKRLDAALNRAMEIYEQPLEPVEPEVQEVPDGEFDFGSDQP